MKISFHIQFSSLCLSVYLVIIYAYRWHWGCFQIIYCFINIFYTYYYLLYYSTAIWMLDLFVEFICSLASLKLLSRKTDMWFIVTF